jgi:hypothetical protein
MIVKMDKKANWTKIKKKNILDKKLTIFFFKMGQLCAKMSLF